MVKNVGWVNADGAWYTRYKNRRLGKAGGIEYRNKHTGEVSGRPRIHSGRVEHIYANPNANDGYAAKESGKTGWAFIVKKKSRVKR